MTRSTGSGRRRPQILVSLILVALVLVACDPAWFLLARNSSATTVIVRVARPGTIGETFEITPGFDGVVTSSLGDSVDSTVDVLHEDCSLIKGLGYISQRVARIEFGEDSAVTLSSAEIPTSGVEWAPKSRFTCEAPNPPPPVEGRASG